MRADGREMNVTWKSGAKEALEKAGFRRVLGPMHEGVSYHPKGMTVEGLHLVFPAGPLHKSQVHIDHRFGLSHFGSQNDDVVYNEEEYRNWYGPLPGVTP